MESHALGSERAGLAKPSAAKAAELAQRLDHPVYGCVYAAGAADERARLLTADVRFAAKLAGEGIAVATL